MRLKKTLFSLVLSSSLLFFNVSFAMAGCFINEELPPESDELKVESGQLTSESEQLKAETEELIPESEELKVEPEQLAHEPEQLKVEEYKTVVEHLPDTPYTGEVNTVEITGSKAKIVANNVIPVKFEGGLTSKNAKKGDIVYLVFDKKLTTKEGTDIIPAGSRLTAEITKRKKGKPFHINGEIEVAISNLVVPSGKIYPLTGTIENNELLDPQFGECNLKRTGIITGSVATFGTLLGLFIGLGSDLGDGTALGAILGGSIGAFLGLAAPGCGIDVSAGQEIYVKLNNDLNVNLK